ncbi:hypothetical protein SAMN05216535_2377 [Stutzerimonas xanthomarina]|uniref:Uncharacterized protein n=2 Tax=Stutzerimonas xanthomarina TaxID=271420 RepID=A0A1M5MRW7_9GAMM|nr:hypothetical protein SAMN05216535_2377 [Stutzerimonas xanthomarina]SHG79802.1 hypothetical protein SAMN02744645_1440 [Stutzerimonas xanthomarina DSM 18231]
MTDKMKQGQTEQRGINEGLNVNPGRTTNVMPKSPPPSPPPAKKSNDS